MQRLPAIAQPRHHPGAKVLYKHVGLGQQPLEQRAVSRVFQIQGNRLFTPVDCGEIGAFAIAEWRKMPCVIAKPGALDLDHPGAQIGQDHRAIRPGQNMGKVNNGDVGKGEGHARLLLFAPRHSAPEAA